MNGGHLLDEISSDAPYVQNQSHSVSHIFLAFADVSKATSTQPEYQSVHTRRLKKNLLLSSGMRIQCLMVTSRVPWAVMGQSSYKFGIELLSVEYWHLNWAKITIVLSFH